MKNKKKFGRLSKILLASALTLVCLPMGNLQAENSSNELSSSKTVKDALKIYFDEPVSQGTLIPGREGGLEQLKKIIAGSSLVFQ